VRRPSPQPPEPRDPGETPPEAEVARILADGFARLPEPYRSAVTLRYVQGVPVDRIARLLSLDEDDVRHRLARGRALLRRALEPELERIGVV